MSVTSLDYSDQALTEAAELLGQRLIEFNKTVCTVESCTGGWISKVLTDVPGSSRWFGYGWVTYSNVAKQALEVKSTTLAEHGAVSEAVVREMAEGALSQCSGDLAVAVSGVAGPGGGSDEKPVGMVCFGIASRFVSLHSEGHTKFFGGDREQIRRQTVRHALELARQSLSQQA